MAKRWDLKLEKFPPLRDHKVLQQGSAKVARAAWLARAPQRCKRSISRILVRSLEAIWIVNLFHLAFYLLQYPFHNDVNAWKIIVSITSFTLPNEFYSKLVRSNWSMCREFAGYARNGNAHIYINNHKHIPPWACLPNPRVPRPQGRIHEIAMANAIEMPCARPRPRLRYKHLMFKVTLGLEHKSHASTSPPAETLRTTLLRIRLRNLHIVLS